MEHSGLPAMSVRHMHRSNTSSRSETLTSFASKRILAVINADAGGGVEKIAGHILADLANRGATTETCFLYPRSTTSAITTGQKLSGIAKAIGRVVTFRPDAIVTFQPTASVIATLAGRLTGCRARIVHQSNLPADTHPVPRMADRWAGALGFYSVNIMNSDATADAFARYPASYRKRLVKVVHGVDSQVPQRSRPETRDRLGIPHSAPTLISCCRLSPEKSLETLIGATACLPGHHLVLAGDGPSREDLSDLARSLGLTDRVHFVGHVGPSRLADLRAAADLFVFPSRSESFGLAAVEAAIQGIPVIASDIPIMREVLGLAGDDGARFVGSWSANAWANAISAATADRDLADTARLNAPLFIDRYGLETMLDDYRCLFEEVLA